MRRTGILTRRRALVAAVTMALVFAVAQPAWAAHTVQWGIDRIDGRRTVESTDPVDFEVFVTFDGDPLPGWPMLARVTPDEGSAEDIPLTTDQAGRAQFTVEPADHPGASSLTVDLCDEDGCLYGSATVDVSATAAPSTTGPTSTPTTATTPTTRGTGGTTTERGGGGSTVPWRPLAGGGLLMAVIGAALFFSSSRRPVASCDWGVVVVDHVGPHRFKTPKGRSCGDYRVEIVTTITDPPSILSQTTTDQVGE